MKQIIKYMKGFEKQCILGPLFKLLEAGLELLVPLVVASIVDTGIGGGDKSYIIRMCLVMIGLGLVGLLCSVTAQYFAASAAVGFCTRLRHALLEHVLGLSYTQIDGLGTSTLITRMTSDINQVQSGVNLTLRLLLRSPFVVFGAMIMAFTIDAQAALVFVGVIPVLCVIVFGIMLITMPKYKKVQGGLDQVTSATRQNLTGVRVLRAFCKEDSEIKDFEERTQALTRSQLVAGRISSLMNPVTYVVINLAIVILVNVGAIRVQNGILTQGLVIALYNYMSQILVELIKMADLIINMTKAAACADRIGAVLTIENDQLEGSQRQTLRGAVEFRNVTAHYAGAGDASLTDIDFSVAPGKTVGIIGGTGSGKTTLVNLIPRLYDAAQGQVLLDGKNVADYDLESLRGQIAPEGGAVPGLHPGKSAVGQSPGYGRGPVGGPEGGPGRRGGQGKAQGTGGAGGTGGHELLRRPAPAADHCPCAGAAPQDPDPGRQRLRPGLRHRCQSAYGHPGYGESPHHLYRLPAGGLRPICR